jgi:hypothetical protein
MLTAEQAQQFRQADADLDELTIARVLELLALLSVTDPREFSQGVFDTLPGLVAELGDVSALLGASMYETAREQAGASGRFTVDLADPPGVVQVEKTARWALAPLFSPRNQLPAIDLGKLLTDRLTAGAPRLVREGGRKTITENTARDPARPKYRRVVNSATGCDFCRMLAGRGSVYHSEDSAGAGRHFHDNCHCTVQLDF